MAGAFSWAEYPFSWWNWWIGDTIGVLVLTPLIVIAFVSSSFKEQRLIQVGLPMLVTLGLSVGLFVWISDWEVERERKAMEQTAAVMTQRVQRTFDNYLDHLHLIANLYRSPQPPDREAFQSLVMPAIERFPGLLGISWNVSLHDQDRSAFELTALLEGFTDFQVVERNPQGRLESANQRPEYVVIRYIEPLQENQQVLGLDILPMADRRRFIEQAPTTASL